MTRAFLVAFALLFAAPALAQQPLDQYRPAPAESGAMATPVQMQPQAVQPAPPQPVYPKTYPPITTGFEVEPPPTPGALAQPAQMGFDDWLNQLRQDAVSRGIRAMTVYNALSKVYFDPRIVEKDQKQPESTVTAQQYWDRLLSDDRIQRGREFYASNRDLMRRVSESYLVRSKYIVALLGIESNYGQGQGKENIINSLTTLAYDGRRSEYFRGELMDALKIIDQGNAQAETMLGSWAGAMGYCQFMPSSYIKFAQDYDNDGRADIWGNVADAAASAANYLQKNGWKVSEEWGQEVEVTGAIPEELIGTKVRKPVSEWSKLGVIKRKNGKKLPASSTMASLVQPDGAEGRSFLVYNNFHVLLRWNRSTYFATAVGMLADELGSR